MSKPKTFKVWVARDKWGNLRGSFQKPSRCQKYNGYWEGPLELPIITPHDSLYELGKNLTWKDEPREGKFVKSKALNKFAIKNKRLKKTIADRDNDLTVAYMSGAADSEARNRVLVEAVKEKDAVIDLLIKENFTWCVHGDICKHPEYRKNKGLENRCRKCWKDHYTEKVRKK